MQRTALLTSALILLLLGGCSQVERPTTEEAEVIEAPPGEDVSVAQSQMAAGDYAAASRTYLALAGSAADPAQRQDYLLSAAEAARSGDDYETADLILGSLPADTLLPQWQVRAIMLGTEIALWRRDPVRARATLEPLNQRRDLSDSEVSRWLLLQSRIDSQSANYLDAARARLSREAFLLNDADELKDNRVALLEILRRLSATALGDLQRLADPDLRGWMELARIAKSYPPRSPQRTAALERWRGAYPLLPDPEPLLSAESRALEAEPATYQQIAVLLPLEGQVAEPARAVLEGILAAYYRQPEDSRPILRIYEEGPEQTDIRTTYQRAVAEGADIVIGPLQKGHVATLAAAAALDKPVLALNILDGFPLPAVNLYQFGLSPEDEARKAAERAWLDGHARAVAVVPRGDWGDRVLRAFIDRWAELGGSLVASGRYDLNDNDYSGAIESVLNLNDSKQRNRDLGRIIGASPKFEPRRRRDVDSIFIGAFPRQGRLFPPQFQFHYAGDLPIYATSHIYTGNRPAG